MTKRWVSLEDRVESILANCTRAGECLVWNGPKGGNGHGRTTWNGQDVFCHRLVLEAQESPPFFGACALHDPIHCDSPACCNLRHLRWGSRSDNGRDRKIFVRRRMEALRGSFRDPVV